jgi:hypothetical protein
MSAALRRHRQMPGASRFARSKSPRKGSTPRVLVYPVPAFRAACRLGQEPGIITLHMRLAAEAEAERPGQRQPVQSERCGQLSRTSIPSIARCGLPLNHAGPHAEAEAEVNAGAESRG